MTMHHNPLRPSQAREPATPLEETRDSAAPQRQGLLPLPERRCAASAAPTGTTMDVLHLPCPWKARNPLTIISVDRPPCASTKVTPREVTSRLILSSSKKSMSS